MTAAKGDEAAPSPADIWELIFGQTWLFGALLTVAGASIECVGLILQKKAHYLTMGDKIEKDDPLPSWSKVRSQPLLWIGVGCFMLHSPLNFLSLKYVGETTIVPLEAFLVVVNFLFSYSILYERFKRRDITATLVCVAGLYCMNLQTSMSSKGHIEDFPVREAVLMTDELFVNVGFATYTLVCLLLLLGCLYVICTVSMLRVLKPFAFPLLVGLLVALCHFFSRIALTLWARHDIPGLGFDTPYLYSSTILVIVFYILQILAVAESVRQLSCRFLVPAFYVTTQALTVLQDLLFFHYWRTMTTQEISIFAGAVFVSFISLFYIDSEMRVLYSPFLTQEILNSPLLQQDALKAHRSIVAIMDEYKVRIPSASCKEPLRCIDMGVDFHGYWRLFPIVGSLSLSILPMALWGTGEPFSALTFLTLFAMYQGWKMGAFISLFAYVGVKKIAHFDRSDFKALYDQEVKNNKNCAAASGPKWKSIKHFVILPNYKEELKDLRMAINSVMRSSIAKTQIGLVLAMEAREAEAREKAATLTSEYAGKFWRIDATYHPEGLPGEVPGKSANTRWAANKLFDEIMPGAGLDENVTLITVGDADSEFHDEYYPALTYYFICAGGGDGKTPLRYTTIWQPPILHMKNYLTQPAIVRLASFITSQHELANLADPNAARVPYSTYSISATLAKAVEGWDPDWISEDWHMALKCFMATGGRLKVTPIFLPILNYTPSADTFVATLQARWTQAKRHALGFSELTFFNEHFPRIMGEIDGRWNKLVFAWRSLFLWVKLLMIHVFMAVFPVISPLNATLLAFFNANQVTQAVNINSWTFLVNCVFQAISLISFVMVFVVSVLLYELVKDRIDNATDPDISIFWRSKKLHLVSVIPQSLLYLPFFFFVASAAEWLAALKTAKTHKFKYVTATEGARQAAGRGD